MSVVAEKKQKAQRGFTYADQPEKCRSFSFLSFGKYRFVTFFIVAKAYFCALFGQLNNFNIFLSKSAMF